MIDRRVSHYKFVERLGAGGMGEIYKAQDVRLNRTVAVKMITAASAGDAEKRARFLQEARAASGLNHPNIITVHDLVSDEDSEFLVMEYVAGHTLAELIQPGGIPPSQVVDYALQITDALAAAHAAGIVHRDIKPGNVMVSGNGQVKVLDFGLAKLTFNAPSPTGDESTKTLFTAMTVEGSILGTVSYMSPEQAEGRPVDARSDIFSFGTVLYEMLTGDKAFKGQSALSTLSAILRDDVRPIAELAPKVPPSLVQLTQRCLAKRPEDRWQTMREVHAELRHIKELSDSLRHTASIMAAPLPAAAQKRSNSKWINWVALAVPAAILVGVVWWFANRGNTTARVAEPEQQAPQEQAAAVKPPDDSPTNDSIIEMVKAKVPTTVIVSHVRTAPFTNFDVSTSELIRLGKEGVPEPVIQAMSSRWRLTPPASPKAPAAPAEGKAGESKGQGSTPGQPPAIPVSTPVEVGSVAGLKKSPAPTGPQVTVPNGTPFEVILAANIAEDAGPGTAIAFTAKQDIRVGTAVVIPAGSAVRGEVVEGAKRRFPGMGGKLMFRLMDVATPGGVLRVRAIPSVQGDNRRSIENTRAKPSKGMAADAGTVYIAYVDGDQPVSGSH